MKKRLVKILTIFSLTVVLFVALVLPCLAVSPDEKGGAPVQPVNIRCVVTCKIEGDLLANPTRDFYPEVCFSLVPSTKHVTAFFDGDNLQGEEYFTLYHYFEDFESDNYFEFSIDCYWACETEEVTARVTSDSTGTVYNDDFMSELRTSDFFAYSPVAYDTFYLQFVSGHEAVSIFNVSFYLDYTLNNLSTASSVASTELSEFIQAHPSDFTSENYTVTYPVYDSIVVERYSTIESISGSHFSPYGYFGYTSVAGFSDVSSEDPYINASALTSSALPTSVLHVSTRALYDPMDEHDRYYRISHVPVYDFWKHSLALDSNLKSLYVDIPSSDDPDHFDVTTWLGDAVSGFTSFEIFPGFSIGGLLITLVSFSVTLWFLKLVAGG